MRLMIVTAALFLASAAAAQNSAPLEATPVPPAEHEPALEASNPELPGGPAMVTEAPAEETKHQLPKDLKEAVQNLAARRQFPEAIKLITKAIATDGHNSELYLLRATVQCRAANSKLCLEDADNAITADGEYAPAYLFRALTLVGAGRAKDALADCESTIRLWQERPQGYNCRGLARLTLREFAPAIDDFDNAIQKDTNFVSAYYNKGLAYVRQDRLDEAIATFSAAIAINGKHDNSFVQRGKARIVKGDVAGARDDFKRALALNRRNVTAAIGIEALQVGTALDVLSKRGPDAARKENGR